MKKLFLPLTILCSALVAEAQVDSPFGQSVIAPTICGDGPYGVTYYSEAVQLHNGTPEGFPVTPQGYFMSLYDAHRITAVNGLPEGMTAYTDVMASADDDSPYGIWYPTVSYGPWPPEWGLATGPVRFDVALTHVDAVLSGPAVLQLEFHVEHRLVAVMDEMEQVAQPLPDGPYQYGNWYPYGSINGFNQPSISPISLNVYTHNCTFGSSSVNTPATCDSDTDGSAAFTLYNAELPVEYSIDGGGTSFFTDEETFTISGLAPGTYLFVAKDAGGKLHRRNFTIEVWEEPDVIEPVCMVTVDEVTGRNLVVWEPSGEEAVTGYNVYRQSGITSEFELIGTVENGQDGIFLDNGSNPAQSSDRYAISTMVVKVCDTEATEDPLSATHRTIHLSANIGVNGEVNLLWNAYEGFTYPNFEIQRSTNGSEFFNVGSVANNSFTYSDMFPPAGVNHYRINVVNADGCDPSRVYTSARSNVIDNQGNPVGMTDLSAKEHIGLYPNPTDGTLHIAATGQMRVSVMDALGREVLIQQLTAPASIDLSRQVKGMYIVRLISERGTVVRRVVRE